GLSALLGGRAALCAAFGDGGVGLGARGSQRAHAAARRRGVWPALGLVYPGFFVVADTFAADGVKRLAADEARDDGLADEVEFALGAVVLGAQARALDDFEAFGPFLPDGHDIAFVGGGGAELVARRVFVGFE